MAIYHLEAKVISRGNARSAVAASAYMSCSQILNDYDGVQHDYTRKQGLVWQQVFLPDNAPTEWQDRAVLWNAVEENEKTKDSRLAREFVVALPTELNSQQWQALLTEFIWEQFVSDGMCADVAIHDTDGHNPHAHIMLTVRPLDEQGKWQHKTEKEYLCVKNGEERGFTAAEFKSVQNEGWEKQYQYKVGQKKEYMTPSAAESQGYERTSKYPKSTKYGRQNPISARWNSDDQLLLWRAAWADTANRYLELAGKDERIDHRSHADRGLDEQPTVHEGVAAREMERKGYISERCELNRQIRADNALLRELKEQVQKLTQAVKNTLPAVAEAMERLRANMIAFKYQLTHLHGSKRTANNALKELHTDLGRFTEITERIKTTVKERKALRTEKKETSALNIPKQRDLTRRITELTETLEELRSEKTILLRQLHYPEDATGDVFRTEIQSIEEWLEQIEVSEAKYSAELDNALKQYAVLKEQAAEFDPVELYKSRQAIRPEQERRITRVLQNAHGNNYSVMTMMDSKNAVFALLNEDSKEREVKEKLQIMQQKQYAKHARKPKENKQER